MGDKRFVPDPSLAWRSVNKHVSCFHSEDNEGFVMYKPFGRDFTVRWKLNWPFASERKKYETSSWHLFSKLTESYVSVSKRMKKEVETGYSFWFICLFQSTFIIKRIRLCSWKILFLVAGIFSFLIEKMVIELKAMHSECKLHLFSHNWQDLTVSMFSWTKNKSNTCKEQLYADCIHFVYSLELILSIV